MCQAFWCPWLNGALPNASRQHHLGLLRGKGCHLPGDRWFQAGFSGIWSADAAAFGVADSVEEVLASVAATAERVADVAPSATAEDAADAVADTATFGVADSAAEVLESAAAMAEMADVAPSSAMTEDAADVDGVIWAAATRAREDTDVGTTSTTAGDGGINCPSSSTNPVYGFDILGTVCAVSNLREAHAFLYFPDGVPCPERVGLQPGTAHHFFWRPLTSFFPFLVWLLPCTRTNY